MAHMAVPVRVTVSAAMRLEAEARSVNRARKRTDLSGLIFMRLSYVGYGAWQLSWRGGVGGDRDRGMPRLGANKIMSPP